MPFLLPSQDRGAFLEFEAMTLSHRLDLNLESIGRDPSSLEGSAISWAQYRPLSQSCPFLCAMALRPPSPPVCALFESFL